MVRRVARAQVYKYRVATEWYAEWQERRCNTEWQQKGTQSGKSAGVIQSGNRKVRRVARAQV